MPPEVFAVFFGHEHYIEPGRTAGHGRGLAVRRLTSRRGRSAALPSGSVRRRGRSAAGRSVADDRRSPPACSSSARAAARPDSHHPVELVELQQPHPHRRRARRPRRPGRGRPSTPRRCRSSSCASGCRPGPGTRGRPGRARPSPPDPMVTATTGPSSRSTSRSVGRLSSTPPSTSSRPSSCGERREEHGQAARRQGGVDEAAAPVHLPGAAHQVDADDRAAGAAAPRARCRRRSARSSAGPHPVARGPASRPERR